MSFPKKETFSFMREPGLWVGLGIFWCWCWIIIQSPREVPFAFLQEEVVSARTIILLVAFVSFCIFALIQNRWSTWHTPKVQRISTWTLFFLYGLCVAIPRFAGAFAELSEYAEVVLSGILIAFFWISWGRFASVGGSQRTLRLVTLSLAVAFLFVLFSNSLDYMRQEIVRTLLPLVSFALLLYVGASNTEDLKSQNIEAQRIPWKLLITLIIQGISLGLLQSLLLQPVLQKCTAPLCIWRFLFGFFGNLTMVEFCCLMSSVGLIIALAFVVFSTHFLKMSFLHLVYIVGFPLLAIGFVSIAWGESFIVGSNPHLTGDVFVFGEIMSTAGYYYVLAITWVVCSYLVSQKKTGSTSVFVLTGAFLVLGQLGGEGLSIVLSFFEANSSMVCTLAIFALLFSGLILATNEKIRGDWGDVSPTAGEQPGVFRRACQSIAEGKSLTAREAEIMTLLARGRSVDFIRRELFISKDTVKTHARSIYRKLNIHSQQELIDSVEKEIEHLKSNDPV